MTPFVIVDVDTNTDRQLLADVAEAATIWSGPTGTGRESPYGWDASASVRVAKDANDVLPGEWIIRLTVNSDQEGAGGYHERDGTGRPDIKVFTGWMDDVAAELAGVVTHEIIESLVNPQLSRTSIGADGKIRITEPADAVEAFYIPIQIASGKTIQCSAWVTPLWFEPTGDANEVYAVGADVQSPGQILQGGYISIYQPETGDWTQEKNGEMRGYRAKCEANGVGRQVEILRSRKNL